MSDDVIKNTFLKMAGQVCWEIYCGQFGLSFNAGNPRLVVHCCKTDPVRDRRIRRLTGIKAEWNFWVLHAYWKLTVLSADGKKQMAATSASSYKHQSSVCRFLNGQRLTCVDIDHKNGKTVLGFDLGAELSIRRWAADGNDLWSLAKPNGYFLEVHGDGTYSHNPGSGIDKRPAVHNRPLHKPIHIQ